MERSSARNCRETEAMVQVFGGDLSAIEARFQGLKALMWVISAEGGEMWTRIGTRYS